MAYCGAMEREAKTSEKKNEVHTLLQNEFSLRYGENIIDVGFSSRIWS